MNDKMTEMFLERDKSAISEAERMYGKYCFTVANRILGSREDAEECVNDALLRAWDSVPPNCPDNFLAYLARITRNLAVDRLRARCSAGRCPDEAVLVLDELDECIPDVGENESVVERLAVRNAVNSFLSGVSPEKADVFVMRYFYMMPVSDIAEKKNCSVGRINTMLMRMRAKLKKHLEKEEIYL